MGSELQLQRKLDGLLRKVAWAGEGGKTKGVFLENLAYLFGSSYCVFEESKLVNSHIKSHKSCQEFESQMPIPLIDLEIYP